MILILLTNYKFGAKNKFNSKKNLSKDFCK